MTIEKEQRPDLREQYARAVHASVLTLREERDTPLLMVAAMGAAAARIASGADRQHLPIASMRPEAIERGHDTSQVDMRTLLLHPPKGRNPDPRDEVAGRLAPNLWHLLDGGQHELVPLVVEQFAEWLVYHSAFTAFTTPDQVRQLRAFSARAVHELLSPMCPACGGSGKRERTRDGKVIKPRGSMQRNATFVECSACMATGRVRPSEAERARSIGVTMKDYDKDGWQRMFTAAPVWLLKILASRVHRPLTAELERGKRRT